MMIIGCDFHPSFQQIACLDQETGEYEERRLSHRGEAVAFYRSLAGRALLISGKFSTCWRRFADTSESPSAPRS